jgi:hypothetical protein
MPLIFTTTFEVDQGVTPSVVVDPLVLGQVGTEILIAASAILVESDPVFEWEVPVRWEHVVGAPGSIRILADEPGIHKVRVRVLSGARASSWADIELIISPTAAASLESIRPDGNDLFLGILSHFKATGDRALLESYWSSLKQLVASDLVHLLQSRLSLSVRQIPPLWQYLNFKVSPLVELPNLVAVRYSPVIEGESAVSGPNQFRIRGAFTGSSVFFVTAGHAIAEFSGTSLYVPSGPRAGRYGISSAAGSSISLSEPVVPTLRHSSQVRALSSNLLEFLGPDPSLSGVQAGDVVRIEDGISAPVEILELLPGNRAAVRGSLPLKKTVGSSSRAQALPILGLATVWAGEAVDFFPAESPLTRTVFVPAADTGPIGRQDTLPITLRLGGSSPFVASMISGDVPHETLKGSYLRLTGGPNSGQVVHVLDAELGGIPLLTFSRSLGTPGETVRAEVVRETPWAGRMIVIEGEGYSVQSARRYGVEVPAEEGGLGDSWALTLDRPVRSGRAFLRWTSGPVLSFSEPVEPLGLSSGDVLTLKLRRDGGIRAEHPVSVLGVSGQRVCVSLTKSTADLVTTLFSLRIYGASESDFGLFEVSGPSEQFASSVEVLGHGVRDVEIRHLSFSFPGLGTISVTGSSAIRNSWIPVPDDMLVLPALRESPAPLDGEVLPDGSFVYRSVSGELLTRTGPPAELVSPRDFVLVPARELSGTEGKYSPGTVFTDYSRNFVRSHISVGDLLFIEGSPSVRHVVDVLGDSLVVHPGFDSWSGRVRYRIERARRGGSFLRITAGRDLPHEMWARYVGADNSSMLESCLGAALGVQSSIFQYDGPERYRLALMGILYSAVNGKTPASVTSAVAAFLGGPVPTTRLVVLDRTSTGIWAAELDEDGAETPYRAFWRTSVPGGVPRLSGEVVNPRTRVPFAVGDEIPEMLALSKGVLVRDGRNPHEWVVEIDTAEYGRSNQIPYVPSVIHRLKPAHTNVRVVLVRGLFDSVSCSVLQHYMLTLSTQDSPLLGRESAYTTDAVAGSAPLRRLDHPYLQMRTLMYGSDLATAAGSDVAISARGGFVDELSEHRPPFASAPLTTLGGRLVRPGDHLYILEGPNMGRFEITSVVGDTELEIISSPEDPELSDVAAIVEGTNQAFVIERAHRTILCEGTGIARTSSTELTDSSGNFVWDGVTVGDVVVLSGGPNRGRHRIVSMSETVLTVEGPLSADATGRAYVVRRSHLQDSEIIFAAEDGDTTGGASVLLTTSDVDLSDWEPGDVLRILSGADEGLQLSVIDVRQGEVWVAGQFTDTDSGISFRIERQDRAVGGSDYEATELLLVDPALSTILVSFLENVNGPFSVSEFINGTPAAVESAALAAEAVAGDVVEVLSGENAGAYRVVSVSGDNVFVEMGSWPVPGVPSVSVDCHLISESADFDVLNDTVTYTAGGVVEWSIGDVETLTVGDIDSISGTLVEGDGADDFTALFSVGDVFRASGDGDLAWTRVKAVLSPTEIELDEPYRGASSAGPLTAQRAPAVRWVKPGDVFRSDLGDFIVSRVVANVVTLTVDTGVGSSTAKTGSFLRRIR